jgi:hypothetical protein
MPPGASRRLVPPRWRPGPRERAPGDGASPQPDPLEHLSSRNRGSTGWRLRCCATRARHEAEPDVSYDPAERTLLLRTAPARLGWIRSACAVPTPPGPRAASPAAPRRASGSADTRGAFHRRASPVGYAWTFAHDAGLSPRFVRRVGSSPQVVTSLWKTHGALCRLRSAARLLTSRSLRSPGLRGGHVPGRACKAARNRAMHGG